MQVTACVLSLYTVQVWQSGIWESSPGSMWGCAIKTRWGIVWNKGTVTSFWHFVGLGLAVVVAHGID